MTPFIKRAHAYIQRAFDRAKQMAFHALVEVRIRKTVVKSMSRIVDTFNKKADPPSLSQIRATEDKPGIGDREKNTNRRIDEQRGEEIPTPCPSPEPLIPSTPNTLPDSPPQQDVIPNNESRITNNDSSAPTEEEAVFPPLTRKNFLKHPIFWARFLGYTIPIGFLLTVLYLNYLPFGYHKTFTIDVGTPGDTTVSEFYLEPSKDFSDVRTADDGTSYRELNGMVTAVFKPKAVLRNAIITVESEGDEINLLPPTIEFDPDSEHWDYDWNFNDHIPDSLINTGDRAFVFRGAHFDGTAKLEMASSSERFENGPMTIYAEWTPKDDLNDYQEIVGHFNWELFQNHNTVTFRIGRMNTMEGPFYGITYNIKNPDEFFETRHTCLIVYRPDPEQKNGFIEMYLDNTLVDRKPIYGDIISREYNRAINLTFGNSDYNVANHFIGTLHRVAISNSAILQQQKRIQFTANGEPGYRIRITSQGVKRFTKLILDAHQ